MKARHIVMILVLIFFATIMFSLKEEKNVVSLVCSTKGDFQGLDSTINLDVKLKENEIRDMEIVIDSILPKEYLEQKQTIINSMNSSGKGQAEGTKDGVKFTMGIQSEYYKSLGVSTKITYKELKEALELQGYSCK